MKLFKIASLGISLGTMGLLHIFAQPVNAQDYIGYQGISVEQDTTIEFEFIVSHGAYKSEFGVIELESCPKTPDGGIIFDLCSNKKVLISEVKPSDNYQSVKEPSDYKDNFPGYPMSNYNDIPDNAVSQTRIDHLGTSGIDKAVTQPLAEYTFEAGKKYVFFLKSEFDNKFAGVVYSLDRINPKGYRQALFNQGNFPIGQLASRRNTDPADADINHFESLINGGILLRFDDTGSELVNDNEEDGDFDDFVVGVGGYERCIYEQSESY